MGDLPDGSASELPYFPTGSIPCIIFSYRLEHRKALNTLKKMKLYHRTFQISVLSVISGVLPGSKKRFNANIFRLSGKTEKIVFQDDSD
jgi:hypothetical protein